MVSANICGGISRSEAVSGIDDWNRPPLCNPTEQYCCCAKNAARSAVLIAGFSYGARLLKPSYMFNEP